MAFNSSISWNSSQIANSYSWADLTSNIMHASNYIISTILMVIIYVALYQILSERYDGKVAYLATAFIVAFLSVMLFWIGWIGQSILTISFIILASGIVIAMWRE